MHAVTGGGFHALEFRAEERLHLLVPGRAPQRPTELAQHDQELLRDLRLERPVPARLDHGPSLAAHHLQLVPLRPQVIEVPHQGPSAQPEFGLQVRHRAVLAQVPGIEQGLAECRELLRLERHDPEASDPGPACKS